MKKTIKIILCLFLFLSFTNIVYALDEDPLVDVEDVVNNYLTTSFMQGLLIDEKRDNPNVNFEFVIDEDKKEINLIRNNTIVLTYTYDDEMISLHGILPTNQSEIDPDFYYSQMLYSQNLMYSILDVMGYSDKDLDLSNEELETNEDFYNEYGFLLIDSEYSYIEDESEKIGNYIEEIRISLNKEKISSLVRDYGIDRPDFISIAKAEVKKPELTIKKKNANLILKWNSDEYAIIYKIYRSDKKDGKYKEIITTPKNSYTDKNVKYGKKYYYKVKTIGEYNELTSSIKSYKLIPLKVSNVKLTSVKTNSIKVSYDKENETGYVIERSTDNKKWNVIKTITKNSTLSYNNTLLKSNKKYYYRVRAYKLISGKKIYGPYSETVSTKTAPLKPNLTLGIKNYNAIKIKVEKSNGATKYIVQKEQLGEYKLLTELNEATTVIDSDLKLGKTYKYRVRACNKYNNCSGWVEASKKQTAKTPDFILTTPKTKKVLVTLKSVSGVDGYEIYRSTSKNGTYKLVKTILTEENVLEYTNGTKSKVIYYYKVRAYTLLENGKKVYTGYSKVQSIKSK